jgi:hypothetical protein
LDYPRLHRQEALALHFLRASLRARRMASAIRVTDSGRLASVEQKTRYRAPFHAYSQELPRVLLELRASLKPGAGATQALLSAIAFR